MKILILASRFPYPLEKGDKLRLYHQIKALSQTYELVLCALSDEKVDEKSLAEMSQFCHKIYILSFSKFSILTNIWSIFLSKIPLSVLYFYHFRLQKKINRIVSEELPDHIYCQLIRCSEYVKDVPIPKTIDFMDDFATIMSRRANQSSFLKKWFFNWESSKIIYYQNKILKKFNSHTIISTSDKDSIALDVKNTLSVIPNGIDLEYFYPQAEGSKKKYDLVFVGNMGYHPNVEAAKILVEKICPLVRKSFPQLNILIAGVRPTKEVLALKSQNIHVTGWLEDIRIAYASSKIMVVPNFLGAGQQNKIMEAMAMGLPCVTTDLVNSSYNATDNEQIMIGNSVQELAAKIIILMTNQIIYKKLSRNGLLFVQNEYSWAKSGAHLEKLLSKG